MTLPQAAVLQTIAEVAVTLAGFVGVILVLRNGVPSRRVDANEMFHMLLSSLGVCGAALLPLIAQSLTEDPQLMWRMCTPVIGLLHVLGALKGVRDHRRGELGLPLWLIVLFAPVSFMLALGSAAVALGYRVDRAPAIYLVGLGWSLLVASATFLALVFRRDDVS